MSRLLELLGIMERLRGPDGCDWDRSQTFESILPHTLEEAYEVADAIERGDMRHLKDELGDLLFQVVFLAQLAREADAFDFEAVAGAIADKLVRRHPHVFGDRAERPAAGEHGVAWEDIKARERNAAGTPGTEASALEGVPHALPALLRAYKLSKRAARVGFDFEHAGQCADKVAEELAEVRAAAGDAAGATAAVGAGGVGAAGGGPRGTAAAAVFEEVGDLLFAATNLARKLDVDAEAALRAANLKFERRFRAMEALAAARDEVFAALSLAAQERLWQAVKRLE